MNNENKMKKSKVGAADSDPLILNRSLENRDTRKSPIGIGDTRFCA
jgi:hypothetical protein